MSGAVPFLILNSTGMLSGEFLAAVSANCAATEESRDVERNAGSEKTPSSSILSTTPLGNAVPLYKSPGSGVGSRSRALVASSISLWVSGDPPPLRRAPFMLV